MLEEKDIYPELLYENVAELPYFRGFLRAVEARYYQSLQLAKPILDLGAGDGHFAARTFHECLEVGFDPAFQSLQEAKGFQVYRFLLNGKGDRIPFRSGSFATLVSNSVLEHIPEVDAVLMEANRILKPSGQFIITVPNNHFTNNLSIARFFDCLGLRFLARGYRKLFNKISRHYHPDAAEEWQQRLEKAGFIILKQWNYFPSESLKILEWGHFFGLPNLINKKLFKHWVLFPKFWYVRSINRWLYKHYAQDQNTPDGAYTFFIAQKR